jgi:hypothetical protein
MRTKQVAVAWEDGVRGKARRDKTIVACSGDWIAGRAISGNVLNQLRYFDILEAHICVNSVIAVKMETVEIAWSFSWVQWGNESKYWSTHKS